MRRALLVVLLALTAAGCASTGRAAAVLITRPLRLPVIGGPSGGHHRSVTIVTDDGLKLEGWLFQPEGPPRGLVVFLHGKDINRQHFVSRVGPFTRRGYAVLAYDQRAHGASEGSLTTFGVREVPDLRRAIDLVGLTPVYLIGESLGAAVSLQAAARDPRIAGVVAGASFAELSTIVEERTPAFLGGEVGDAARRAAEAQWGFRLADVSPARDAANIHAPVLLLHGLQDTFIVPAHSRRIFDRLAGPRRIVWLDGVGHADVLLHDEAWAVIEAWLDELTASRR